MSMARRDGLNECKDEFPRFISISDGDSGESLVDLGKEGTIFFQIKWKFAPSPKHFARVKCLCRIACTEAGTSMP